MASRELTKVLHALASTKVQDKALGKLESLRFRSTAYTSGSGPKKATYAKKELMDETTTSTNAYAVFTTEAAAEHVAENLNGTVVLDRHIRADYLGRPAKIDNRRCIFVGNLSFVNEETSAPADGEQKRPTAKVPADAEEGLWRTFGKVGEVESVRVVRDQETRVSKGFGYVQFRSENSVEAALLLNDRKFPPMLPRKLRVMRAKKTKSREQPSGAVQGRPFGRDRAKNGGGKVRPNGGQSGPSGRAGLVFEGHRASSTSGKYSLGGKKKHKKRPDTRSSRRGAAYKAAGARDRRQGKA
jgi:nucleolar protein 12